MRGAAGRAFRVPDLRLTVAALTGWAVVAAALGWSSRARATVLLVAGVTVLLCVTGSRSGLGGSRLRGAWAVAALAAAVSALLLVALAGHLTLRESGRLDELARARAVAQVEVVITGEPVRLGGGLGERAQVLARADARSSTARGVTTPEQAAVVLRGDERLLGLRWHETVRVGGRLTPAQAGTAEVALLRVSGPVLQVDPPGRVARGAERLREGLRRAVDSAPPDARGLVPGLVIGDTSRTPPDLTEAMRATGLTHLTAVSGANIKHSDESPRSVDTDASASRAAQR